jgi:hypothetical protein
VENTSTTGPAAIAGVNQGRTGVLGTSTNGEGVWGLATSPSGTGVRAAGTGNGAALSIEHGNIKVYYAGIGSETPVFIHQVKTGAGGNICSGQAYGTVIDNALIDGNPNAILIVTPSYGPNNANGHAPAVGIPAVYYDVSGTCGKGAGKWVIYNLNSVAQTDQSLFNVLVVVP